MAYYSHSKIQTFFQCKYKYKLSYIDKIKVTIPNTIEAFMGSCVHKALEVLYQDIICKKIESIEELQKNFINFWKKDYTNEILINDKYKKENDYILQGLKYLIDYYQKYHPFQTYNTLSVETKDFINLNEEDKYHIMIDRLSSDNFGNYYVCDYKTSGKIKTKEELKNDFQLSMYSLFIKEKYPQSKKIYLVWYYLAFNEKIVLENNDSDSIIIKRNIIDKISQIKSCNNFETNKSNLCNWCLYKNICPEFNPNKNLIINKNIVPKKIINKNILSKQKSLLEF